VTATTGSTGNKVATATTAAVNIGQLLTLALDNVAPTSTISVASSAPAGTAFASGTNVYYNGAAAGSLHLFPPVHVGPEAIVTLLILPLLFEGSLKLDPGDLRAYGGLIGTLAVPGTLVAALAIAGAGTLWRLPGPTAFLLGAVAAATDPVSVIALIQEVRLDRRLGALLEGEAVLNDGVAIVLFTLVVSPAGGGLLGAAGRFVWLLAAGGAIGFLAGRAVSYALGRVRQPLIEALGSLILAVGAFIAAEALGASGVIAVALAGITFGSRGLQHLTEDARQTLRTLWDVIAFLANSALFLLIGLEVPVGLLARHAGLIGTVILAALAVRAAAHQEVLVSETATLSGVTVTPHLACRNAAAAVEFYQKAFGAVPGMVQKMPDGRIMHADLDFGGTTATASGTSSVAAVLNPVNPSMATTCTASRQDRGRSASQVLNARLERPSTMSSSRAGPVPARTAVRSMISRARCGRARTS